MDSSKSPSLVKRFLNSVCHSFDEIDMICGPGCQHTGISICPKSPKKYHKKSDRSLNTSLSLPPKSK